MICVVLLAGGESRRFGGDKLSARLPDGRQLALAAAEAVAAAGDRRLVVARPDRTWLASALAERGWNAVVTAAAERGMGASLAAGIAAAADCDGWLIGLADMPLLEPATAAAITAALRAGASAAAPFYAGRRGHPVGFSAQLRSQLLALDGDTGARAVLQQLGDRLARVEVNDPGILIDIDRPEDLATLSPQTRPGNSA